MNEESMKAILDAPIVFGLVKQGHIPTIEKLLNEGCDWQKIGAEIGWEPATAREYYERYLQKDNQNGKVFAILAQAVEYLKQVSVELKDWDKTRINTIVFAAERHLLSTPKKV